VKVERIDRDGGLQKCDCHDRSNSYQKEEIEVERAPGVLKGIPDRPQEPEKKEEKDWVGRIGGHEEKGDQPPVLTLLDLGGIELENRCEAWRGKVQ
jgi:hypothetical protein